MIYFGTNKISVVQIGNTTYSAIYVGSTQVFGKKTEITINLNYGSGNSGTSSIKGILNKSLTSISKSLPTTATSGNTVDPITWHTSSTFNTSNIFNNSTVITKDMVSNNAITLYAEYSSSVIFNLNYDGLTYQTVKLNLNNTVTIPSAPTRDKYTFGGWYLNSSCTGNAITSSTTFTQSTTVYAKWTKIQYTLAWNFDGGTTSGSYTTAGTYDVDTTIVYPTVTKTNYALDYWSPNPTKLTENVTIRAYWTQTTIPVESVSLDQSTATIAVGKSITLTVTVSPSNASNNTITWATSNSSVATVSNGTVTGQSSGTVTITATSNNGKSASCSVTVQAAGTNGWVGSANAGAISMNNTNFTASGSYKDVNNKTSASISTLRYRVYNSDGLTYSDFEPTISYSWLVSGDGLSLNSSTGINNVATYSSRGTTVGNARSGTIIRRAKFTYKSSSTTLDSNTITVTQEANTATLVRGDITYGTPVLSLTNNLTAGGGSVSCSVSVTNTQPQHYTYTSGSSTSPNTVNLTGSATLSIDSQTFSGSTTTRFSLSDSTVSHSTMGINEGTDKVVIKAVNNGDSSKYTTKEVSVSNSITQTNVRGNLESITFGWVDENGMESFIVISVNYNNTSWPNYLTCIGTYKIYNVYTSGSQAYSGTEQDYVSPTWSKPSWVSSISSTTLNGVPAYAITLEQNNGTLDRTGTITATSGSVTASVDIKQLCKPQENTQSIGFLAKDVLWSTDNTSVTFKLQGYASPSMTIYNVKVIATTSSGSTVITTWQGSSYTLTSEYSNLVYDPDSVGPSLIAVTISNIDYETTFKVQYTYGSSIKTVNLGMPKQVIDGDQIIPQ